MMERGHNRGAFTSKSGVFSANGGVSDSRNAYLNGVTADAFGRLHISWCGVNMIAAWLVLKML